jgi:hypothetical protein
MRIVIYIIVMWIPFNKTSVRIVISEVLWNGVQITIIDITIPTDVLGMMSR